MRNMGKCKFNSKWLTQKDYKDWLLKDGEKAKCSICHTSIDVGAMGESALKSHIKSKKHQSLLSAQGTLAMSGFLKPPSVKDSSEEKNSNPPATVSSFFVKEDTLKAETIWAMHCIEKHFSYHANVGIDQVFQCMFPDSSIAKGFSCGEKKMAYLTNFGLAPYFSELLRYSVNEGDYVLLFDESLNRMTHTKQMDIHVRFWANNLVETRYVTSQFMGHCTSEQLLGHFLSATNDFDYHQLVQVSMDGPNVNWKMYELLQERLLEDRIKLLNLGSCGLHVIHGAFSDAMIKTGWNIEEFFSSAYWLLSPEAPARREDYIKVTESEEFPYKFCKHRWVENTKVAEKMLIVLPNLRKYYKAVHDKTVSKPTCKSFATVEKWLNDPLLVCKIYVFLSLSRQVVPYLEVYQTDKPMVPFMWTDLSNMLKGVMSRIVKSEKLSEAAKCTDDLIRLKLDEENFVTAHKVDIGFAAEKELKRLVEKKKISEKEALGTRSDVKSGIKKMLSKLQEKCPLKYKIVQASACLSPKEIVSSPQKSIVKFTNLLQTLEAAKKLSEAECDTAKLQYRRFIDDIVPSNDEKFKNYDHKSGSRLDQFFSDLIGTDTAYSQLWRVVKFILVLSHGQATVERGFSINKELYEQNLKEKSFISQRIVTDHVNAAGGAQRVPVTKKLLASVSSARSRYMQYLEEEKQKQKTHEASLKRKSIEEEISELKAKKRRLERDVEVLQKSADELFDHAENEKKVANVRANIAKGNSFRRSVSEKQREMKLVEEKIDAKITELKDSL